MAFQLENTQQNKNKSSSLETLLKKEIQLFGPSFSNKKKEALYVELAVLLEAGLTLKDGLTLIAEEQKKITDKKLLESIVNQLIAGKNLSEAIKTQKQFTPYEYYSLQIGEKTGTLQRVTKELGEFFKRKNEQKRVVLNALSYPIVVLFTAFLAILFMLQFVVPMFADIFKQNNVTLPWITQKIIGISNVFQESWWVLFILIFSIFIVIKLFSKTDWYQKYSSWLLLKIPFVGVFTKTIKIAQFTQAIALLTSAKVPLLNGIQLTKKMVGFYPLQQALIEIEENILQGKSLHASIHAQSIFDKKMASLIKVAEETNQNEVIFKRLTHQYNEEIAYKSKMISTTIEPFIILILGGIVAVVLIAMYLPMFKLSTVIS